MPFGSEGKERIRGKDLIAAPDEKEHSIEMHLPYIRKIFEQFVFSPCFYTFAASDATNDYCSSQEIKIVPILVGSIPATGQSKSESSYGAVLAPYLTRPDTLCVVSSDFCHW
jgi:predicted class III extradiol MEMO1 family dioxygenase